MFVYNSEVYCNSCGEAIKSTLQPADDVPQSAPTQTDWDYPPHCGSGPDCLEAIALPSGRKVGAILGGLSPDGVGYLRHAMLSGGEVAELWADHFAECSAMDSAVPVIFRVGQEGEVFALFPTLPSDRHGSYCVSYEHIGQHSGVDYFGCIDTSRPASKVESEALSRELERIGYRLRIVQRVPQSMHQLRREGAVAQ